MPEYRQDPVTERWVVLAPERAWRPHAFVERTRSGASARGALDCPFCPGHEAFCPECLLALPSDELSPSGAAPSPASWSVRVIHNLYPAVTLHGAAPTASDVAPTPSRDEVIGGDTQSSVWAVHRPAYGSHEVVVESARHITQSHQLTPHEIELTLRAYQIRFQAWRAIAGLRWGLAFKNDGPRAGASLEHVHSQLVALPAMAPRFQLEWDGARRWYERHGACVFCGLIAGECQTGTRVVEQTEAGVLLCPYASRTPYEMWLIPRGHAADFDRTSRAQLSDLSDLLWRALQRLEGVAPGCDFNYLVHTSPFDTTVTDHYHWHLEIIPRMAHLAGYEWGTDLHINVLAPEQAAQLLRTAQTSKDRQR